MRHKSYWGSTSKTTIIPIKGMHCRSCELLIGESLSKIPGIDRVTVSLKDKCAVVHSKKTPLLHQIKSAIEEAGYEVGQEEKKSWITSDKNVYREFCLALIILLGVYFVWNLLGLKTNFNFGSPSNLLVVWLIGLTAGISTCMALVGGLVLGISARHSEIHPEATPMQKFRPHLFFNIGRIVSYTVLGGVVGLIGSAFQLSGQTLGVLMIIVGIVMLTLGLQLTELFPRLSDKGLTLPAGIGKFLGLNIHQKEYSHRGSFMIGALTFFLPCGFTQAMQLYAMSTGSFSKGALILGIFALGTAPGLLGVGGLTSIIKGAFARHFFKFAGLVVVILAIVNISNGYNLGGWQSFSFQRDKAGAKNTADLAAIVDGSQIVRMTQGADGYTPNHFNVTKGIPVKWIITGTDSGSCSNSIVVPKLGLRFGIKPGEMTVPFTPLEAGEIKFSCVMGMYRGSFTVVENNTPVASQTSSNPTPISSQVTESNTPSATPTTIEDNPYVGADAANAQIIDVTYTTNQDIQPNKLTAKLGKEVRVVVNAKDDGNGCMGTIMIPGLANTPQFLEKGKLVVLKFTPIKAGTYQLTCAMGVPRGTISITD